MSKVVMDRIGTKRYYNDAGQIHREDGPAVEYRSGYKVWSINGKIHREDGPAVVDASGREYYYLFGNNILKRKFTPEYILQLKMIHIIEI